MPYAASAVTGRFTIAAVAAIALGIGATTAVFSVVDPILFRSLPYTEESRLVSVGLLTPADTNEFLPDEDYWKWRSRQTAFESMTGFAAGSTGNFSDNCDLVDANPVREIEEIEGRSLNLAVDRDTRRARLGIPTLLARIIDCP